MKVIELTFDPEVEMAGIDAIALVENPAHMENWLAFSVETEQDKDMLELAKQWGKYGESPEELLEEGFELVSIRRIGRDEFSTKSSPNDPSYKDYAGARVRYKYVGPQDSKNRDFCGEMMENNRVYRIEDINRMTSEMANPQFGQYDIFQYRGSYNCRHYWVELIYKPEGRILNDADRKRDLVGEQYLINEPTETKATANAKERKKNERMSLVQVVNGDPLFNSKEEALKMAELIGCKGYHTHKTEEGVELYMPCETHQDMFDLVMDTPTYTDEVSGKTLTEPIKFSTDDDKMEITGAAMVPNKLIIRRDVFGEPYYVFFTADTIKKLQQSFMEKKLLSSTNIEHIERLSAESHVVESWIVEDTEKDKSAALGLQYPVGTWVITMKVNDPKIWGKVKKGELKGYSIEGFFDEVRRFNTSDEDFLMETIKTIITNIKDDK